MASFKCLSEYLKKEETKDPPDAFGNIHCRLYSFLDMHRVKVSWQCDCHQRFWNDKYKLLRHNVQK